MSDPPTVADTAPGATAGDVSCPACGTANPPENRFCGACGASLAVPCAVCGAANPAGNRFCGSCGSPLTRPKAPSGDAPLEERKIVTIVFADLTASTEMAARLDPEDLARVLKPFFEAMVAEIERFGGTVEKFIGDAIVAVFGAPVAHEDDPERAVRAALAMQARLAALAPELAASSGQELAMRIGVNTGEVVTQIGPEHEGIVTGEPVNVAARLEAIADPGTIVVGERTHRDTADAIAYRALGNVVLKGIDHPVRAWVAEGDRPGDGRGRLAPLVGRASELELLQLILSRTVRERRPGLVTIVGPAGIGKSRLAAELLERVAASSERVQVVRGRCLPYGEGLTYWPLAEILKGDAEILDSDRPEEIPRKAAARLDVLLAGHEGHEGTVRVLLSSIGVPVAPDPLAGAEPRAARELIARSWREYLESLGAGAPLVAIVEDLHWADPSLLELIEYLAARVEAPVLFLCTARPDLVDRRATWGGGQRNATTIELQPLSGAESADLLHGLVGGKPLPADAMAAILERSEGNPFFAEELLRMVVEDGSLVERDGEWAVVRPLPSALPDTVQGVIASRIDMLEVGEKRAIQDAAVVGRIFWEGAVARLGLTDPAPAMEALAVKGLVRERDRSVIEGERELIFHHVLTRDVAYASIPRSRRAEAHAAAGRWIEDVTRGRADEFAEILAYHFDLAGDHSRHARYALLAGGRLRRVFSAPEAIRWYDRALSAADAAGDLETEAGAALGRGTAHEQLGEFPQAEADYRRGLGRAREAGAAVTEARALAALAHVLWLQDRYEEGRRVQEEALARSREVGATELEARLLYTAGTIAFGRGDFAEALGRHERGLAVSRATGDREGEALALHGLCETRWFTGPLDEALAAGRRADALLHDLGQRPMVHHNEYMVGWVLWGTGAQEEALRWAERSAAGCREIGNRRDEAFALGTVAFLLNSLGRLADALRFGAEAVAVADEIGSPRLRFAERVTLTTVLWDAGDTAGVEARVGEARGLLASLEGTFFASMLFGWECVLALSRGDRTTARERLAAARVAPSEVERTFVAQTLIRGGESTGDAEVVREALALLESVPTANRPDLAWAGYGRALLAVLEGDPLSAERLARESLAASDRVDPGPLGWRCRAALWRALRAQGRDAEAAAAARDAANAFRELGAGLAADERDRFLAQQAAADLLSAAPA